MEIKNENGLGGTGLEGYETARPQVVKNFCF